MRSDAKECFAQVDENGDMKNAVGIQMAEIDAIVSQEFAKEGMSRNYKSPNQIIFEYNELMGVGTGKSGTAHLPRGAIWRFLGRRGCLQSPIR